MKNERKQLRRISLGESDFIKVLESTHFKDKVDDMTPYFFGYQQKYRIKYNDDMLVCKKNFLVYCGVLDESELDEDRDWYQVLCLRDVTRDTGASNLMNPAASCRRIKKVLKKHYTDEQIIETYHQHEKDDSTILHHSIESEKGKILTFENCYYYDASGAYASELIQMFPKCQRDFKYLFDHRHDNNNEYKNDFNFFVGCLTQNEKKRQALIAAGRTVRDIYPKTRHYIVDRITEKVLDIKDKLNGDLIYVNTDGIIVQNPQRIVKHSDEIGKFKLEYQGTIYTYRGDNYALMQFGDKVEIIEDDLKGNLPIALRDKVNLKEGRVVKFDKKLVNGVYQYINVEEIQL